MIPDPTEDWWSEYDPDPIPGLQHYGGTALALIASALLLAAVAWQALCARWRR